VHLKLSWALAGWSEKWRGKGKSNRPSDYFLRAQIFNTQEGIRIKDPILTPKRTRTSGGGLRGGFSYSLRDAQVEERYQNLLNRPKMNGSELLVKRWKRLILLTGFLSRLPFLIEH